MPEEEDIGYSYYPRDKKSGGTKKRISPARIAIRLEELEIFILLLKAQKESLLFAEKIFSMPCTLVSDSKTI